MTARIAILYTELGDYSLACLRALRQQECYVLLVHWPVNPEAPFKFKFDFLDEVHNRDQLSNNQLLNTVKTFKPDLILCSGWMDKGYVNVCRMLNSSSITVLSLDNHWNASFKQILATLLAPFTLKRSFDKAFVPGQVQKNYALKLGFKAKDIQVGFYSANTSKFLSVYEETHSEKKSDFPKRFLYLGRYVKHKGIFDLWEAFKRFQKHHDDWELWCVGTGDQYENRVQASGIKHFGFVQPDQMLPILRQTGVYILPSHFEPWGVSVHEMAVAGFPMLLSDKIGAREAFLNGNGCAFKSGSVDELADAMYWVAAKSNEQMLRMSEKSHELGMKNTPEIWAERLMSLLK